MRRLFSARRPRARQWRNERRLIAALFLGPAALTVLVLVAYPMVHTLWLSLHDTNTGAFVGLANYGRMFSTEETRRAILNNIVWVVVAPTIVTVLGLMLAVLTQRVRWSTALKTILFMPMAISFLAAGVTFRLVYDADPERGVLNAVAVVLHDAFRPASPYPGATVREGSGLVAEEGAIRVAYPVQAGDEVYIPLVGLPSDQVPDEAQQAAGPEPGPGLRGVVWRDFTRGGGGTPGVVDAGELGLPGVVVEVLHQGEVVAETRTDERGRFAFPELAGGEYAVRLAAGNFTPPFRGLTWLGPGLVTPAIIGSYVWVWAGFAMVVISAGLAAIPREAVEAARVDGATEWQVLRLVTIPLVRPVLAVVVVTLVINVLKIFDLVLVLPPESSQADATVVGLELYHVSFTELNTGLGSALAVLLFLLVLPGMIWRARVMRRQERRLP